MDADGKVESLVDNHEGAVLIAPTSDLPLQRLPFFTDPDKRRAYHERELPGPGGNNDLWTALAFIVCAGRQLTVPAHCEYPNGLALSPDERTMYVANTRSSQYIHGITLDAAGNMVGRSIFADMNEGTEPGIPTA